jgi:hypothetical protein
VYFRVLLNQYLAIEKESVTKPKNQTHKVRDAIPQAAFFSKAEYTSAGRAYTLVCYNLERAQIIHISLITN